MHAACARNVGRSQPCVRREGAPTRRRRSSSEIAPASHHQHAAEPDQRHHRLPPDARHGAAVGRLVAERDVELAEADRADAGLRRRHLARGVEALGRQRSWPRSTPSGSIMAKAPRCSVKFGPCAGVQPLEAQRVAGDLDRLAGLHGTRCAPCSKQATPTMPRTVTPTPTWASAVPKAERGSPARRRSIDGRRCRADAGLERKIGDRAQHQPDGEPDAERGQHRPPCRRRAAWRALRRARPRRPSSGAGRPLRRSPRFQASNGPNGTTSSSGTISGPKVRLKKGAPTEILSPVTASSASG